VRKLLALNRGEIAIRILRAANELKLRTVAVFSHEDRFSLHRLKADEAYLIGAGQGPIAAYLDIDAIIALAQDKGVDAIHPGYGFLSESPELARACAEAGITFIGPRPDVLELLGDKIAARRLAQRIGIPTLPGTDTPIDPGRSDLAALAGELGVPLIVKAVRGGGGRGMRIVETAAALPLKIAEAAREADAAFGQPAVFIERYIRRAKHIEVQLIGDAHGHLVHLHERDCSVQRRHQKVVEIAPAAGLPAPIRRALAEAALALGRAVRYSSAGTVEFLVDVDTHEWFFIEVNPRIQVEHTVTEAITGIDIVRTQIHVAQGLALGSPEIGLPDQSHVSVHGAALQCRVTTEDPAAGFVSDYGKIHTYRSPAGFGIRLDGASAFTGAVVPPCYDSLLVKVTAWGQHFPEACQRMGRALREFRIRGVTTNIPFLENVVEHPVFQRGEATTGFVDATPELLAFTAGRDRAGRLLAYLADTIVNGNPDVAGHPRVTVREVPRVPQRGGGAPPAGTRQQLETLGPAGFAAWTREQTRLLVTDTTFRDAHQSLLATRVRTIDMLRIAPFVAHACAGLYSLEMWGGATFDVALRFLHEDPWKRLHALREAIPNICFQMLLRAANAVGYAAYPDNVVREFITEAAAQGIDIFRVFDSLNGLGNMGPAVEAVLKTGLVCEAAICYTGDLLDPTRTKYSLRYYVRIARELEAMGTHILGIKDMAGLLRPYAAEQLVAALRDAVGIPIHLHTHDTSGINAATLLKASDSGVDVVDAALAPMSGTTSQPNLNSLVAALAHTARDTGLDLHALNECARYWEIVRGYYSAFDTGPSSGTAEVYAHEMPGGQYTNLKAQADAMGLGARWHEVPRVYAEVNAALGDIVKVTPSSKAVGDLALFLVGHDMTVADLLALPPSHGLAFPDSVVDLLLGTLGEPEGGWPDAITRVVLRGRTPTRGRPGAILPSVDLAKTAKIVAARVGPVSRTDVLSYLMYPTVFTEFATTRKRWGDVDALPTPAFFYGLRPGEELDVELEPGKTLLIRLLSVGDATATGSRTVFFELNGQMRDVDVRDRSLAATVHARRKASPTNAREVGAPTPGVITKLLVEEGQPVREGAPLLVIEAMKIQSTL
jgi:pyruvate carboxylase